MKRPAVFLDRDGTLIEEVNYLSRVEDLRLFPFSAKAVKMLKDVGFFVIVVTNQSGVGRGVFAEAAVHEIHAAIQDRLSGMIDGFYYCPHLPAAGCECRKPLTGMIDQAVSDLSVDTVGSWMVGDKTIDVEAGRNAGLATVLVSTGYGEVEALSMAIKPDHFEIDLLAAAKRIIGSAGEGQ